MNELIPNQITNCHWCPRACGADRTVRAGACGVAGLRVARAALHHWEEPCISGTRGSGTVFFSGCSLKCCYCQNHDISAGGFGRDICVERLAGIFLELQAQGAHNVNLVNPTHVTPWIAPAVAMARARGLLVPIVYNSSGYDSPEGLALMDGVVDIYLPDLKYLDSARSLRYSGAADYFAVASRALEIMAEQVGPARFDDHGLLTRGLVVRHMVLPGCREDSLAILDWLAAHLDPKAIVLSLMSQYMPCHRAADFPEINRRLTTMEYDRVLRRAGELGFAHAYCQQRSSASDTYVPPFNLEGV